MYLQQGKLEIPFNVVVPFLLNQNAEFLVSSMPIGTILAPAGPNSTISISRAYISLSIFSVGTCVAVASMYLIPKVNRKPLDAAEKQAESV